MIIYGWGEKQIASVPVKNHSCNHCNSQNSLHVEVYRSYIHIFWIPLIPLVKKVYSECSHCRQSLSKNEMPPDLQNKALQIKQEAKTPFWYYIGLTLVALLVIAFSVIIS